MSIDCSHLSTDEPIHKITWTGLPAQHPHMPDLDPTDDRTYKRRNQRTSNGFNFRQLRHPSTALPLQTCQRLTSSRLLGFLF